MDENRTNERLLNALVVPILLTGFGIVGIPLLPFLIASKSKGSGALGFVFGAMAVVVGAAGAVAIGLPAVLLGASPWIALPAAYYLTLVAGCYAVNRPTTVAP